MFSYATLRRPYISPSTSVLGWSWGSWFVGAFFGLPHSDFKAILTTVAKKPCPPAAIAWRRPLFLLFSASSLPALAAWKITFSDLNPPGASDSCAYAVSGSQQAGCAGIGGLNHAVLWSGAAGFFVDLHPSGTFESIALATSGTQQVGRVTVNVNGEPHAARWAGTAESFEDLHPRVGKSSVAFALDGARQGGYVMLGSWPTIQEHAAIFGRGRRIPSSICIPPGQPLPSSSP